jgi:vacuolar protein sorting-associated protein 13A/C
MLEGLVASLLNRFLGMYVKNFDAKQLNVGIWSGDVKLRDLELRREALDQLHLPVNVVEGHLGQLTLSIPWSNLRGKPVKVNIEDVFLLAAPKEEADSNPEDDEKRAQAVKIEKLESAELLKERNTEGMSQEEQQKNQSFTQTLVTAIVDNLQVSIKNVHIRYEDSIAAPGHPFAIGLTVQEISAVSTDADWRPTFIQSTSGTTHKLATLGKLAFYWNTDAELFGTGKGTEVGFEAQGIDHDEMMSKFRAAIENTDNHQYMLKPVTGRAGIELDKTGKVDRPKVKARLLFNELGFVLDEDQYRDALMLVDLFHYFIRHQEYKKFEPEKSPKEDPRAWITFAGKAVLRKIQDRNRRWTWDYFKERRDDRVRYIELFKKKKKEEKMPPAEIEEVKSLEAKSTYEDLRFWRSLARNQLRKENAGIKKAAPQTWSSWIWRSGKKTEEEAPKEEAESTEMTEEQRKELYNAIDWDEKTAIAESVDLPRESVKMQVESSLRTGSFTLKRDPQGGANEILKLIFDNFKAKAIQRPDSFLADIKLGGLRVYDGTTEGSLFPQIVRVKDVAPIAEDEQPDNGEDDESIDDEDEEPELAKEPEDILFDLRVENNPLDGSADTAVTMKLKSIEVIYNPKFVVGVTKFFKPPERDMESIGALMETAGATVEGLRKQTRAGLEFALEEHKTVNVELDIQAPLIIVPESITEESTLCLIMDTGHVSMNSELVDQDTMKEIQDKQKKKYSEDDYKQLEGLMYDKFLLKLDSTQVLIGPGIEATRAELSSEDDSKNLHIIDRIGMDFVLETSIIPKASDLTKTRISGHLPVLHASISDKKYKNLMRLIDVAVPKFDDEDDLPKKAEAQDVKSSSVNKSSEEADQSRPRSKSFSLRDSEKPIVEADSDSEDNESVSSSKKLEPPVNLHRRNFEFKFTVDKLQGSLYRSSTKENKPDKLLVELVAEHFQLDFYLRPFDMVAEVLLKSLSVEDYIEEEPLPEFKQIISSKGFNAEDDADLFNVKFVKVNSASPEFNSTYEGIATNLDVYVSTINLVITRKTLLTLLDFVLLTFASPDPAKSEQDATKKIEQSNTQQGLQEAGKRPQAAEKIRIKAELKGIALILNNDGVRLATLSLNTADVGLFLVGKTMKVQARMGSLSLLDDINQGASEDSPLRKLITIEGEHFADFRFKTFDSAAKDFPGFDSEVFLRSDSIKISFLEEPFRKIMDFGVKFGKMQAIFNAAREAAAGQASQIQENASRMHFDVVVKTPILVFPRVMVGDRPRDLMTAYLGEIYANNKFARLKGAKDAPIINKLWAGVRHIRLTTEFHYDEGESEELEMIEKAHLDFKIMYLEHQPKIERPDMEIQGSMSPVNLRISQTQLKFLLELSKTIPAAFAGGDDVEGEVLEELPNYTTEPAKAITQKDDDWGEEDRPTYQGPELGSSDETFTKLDLVFKAETIGLELILAKEDEPVRDLDAASLSKFSINDTNVKLRMLSDGALESELLIHSFTIRDSRTKETNKFRKIMSLINNDVQQQFMASVTISGGKDKHLIAMLTVDSPRIIFALDYLFALSQFASAALATLSDEKVDVGELPEGLLDDSESSFDEANGKPDGTATEVESDDGGMSMSFRVNIVDAQIILIANPTISNTEAIVLGTKQVLVSQQNAQTLQISKVGMFLCRMDKFETSRLRILDDFSVQMSVDNRSQGKGGSLMNIHIDIEPLVLRLSLRDILLALQIVNKASAMTSTDKKLESSEPKKIQEVKAISTAPSTKRKSIAGKSTQTKKTKGSKTASKPKTSTGKAKESESAVLKREEMTAEIHGIRVILIGDLHELPMLDFSVKKFDVDVRDWSAAMTVDTSFNSYLNVYNFSKSAWEPLIEPWQLGFHMSKDQDPECLSVEVYSHKSMELTVTSATIALFSKAAQFLSTDEDVLSKPRGADAPYRIRNYTGFEMNIWADSGDTGQGNAAKLEDGEEYPWRFEDPTTMRENLTPEGDAGLVGVKLEGSGFDSINRIPVIREGETLYNLKPKKDRILHRMLVEVVLGADNVKYITFRSPLLVENKTHVPVEIGVYSAEEGHLLKIEKILPGEGRPAPVGSAFVHALVLRPDQGFGYDWSSERLFWKDLLKKPTRTITCKPESGDQTHPFFFQLNATFDKKDPMTK